MAGVATAVAAFGLVTFVRVAIVDIVVGLQAHDQAEKSMLADRYADVPAVLPKAVYEIGPVFFMIGCSRWPSSSRSAARDGGRWPP